MIELFREVETYFRTRYPGRATLIRKDFYAAVHDFDDKSIDLLHIDGTHTFEAVSNDFHTWRPKLSDRSVVLFHDINVTEQNAGPAARHFGVRQFFDGVKHEFPHFEFEHCYGLGVLVTGPDVPASVSDLVRDAGASAFPQYFATKGAAVSKAFEDMYVPLPVHDPYAGPIWQQAVRRARNFLRRVLDENSIKWLEKSMAEKGYLDGKEMASAFRLLRSNSLVWHYVVGGYLFGEAPPAFDVLFWNMDSTRMPATMHSWYLRNFYLENLLIKKDALTLAGEKIDLGRISQPLFAVSAEDDHIAPWRQTFRINNFVAGQRRYVLSTSGHILGIVNPVVNPPKRDFHVGAVERHDTPDEWLERAEFRHGSWWEDWMAWLKPQSGSLAAPKLAPKGFPALADAPGTYVLEP